MQVDRTANTWGNMLGNVGQYFFGIEDKDLVESPYTPTVTSNSGQDTKYYTRPGLKEDVYRDLVSYEVQRGITTIPISLATYTRPCYRMVKIGNTMQKNLSQKIPQVIKVCTIWVTGALKESSILVDIKWMREKMIRENIFHSMMCTTGMVSNRKIRYPYMTGYMKMNGKNTKRRPKTNQKQDLNRQKINEFQRKG